MNEFPDSVSPADILESMTVEPLLPYSQYPDTGLGFSLSKMGFMVGRDRYVASYGFVLLTRECTDALAALLADKRVLEVGAGTGFLAHCLSQAGVNIVAQDRAAPGKGSTYFFGQSWKLDHVGPFEDTLSSDYDAVILSWPCMGSPFAANVARKMVKGQLLIYQGEGPGGCTADDDFFEYVAGDEWLIVDAATMALNQHHRQFPAIHDRWIVFEKQ